MINNIFYLLGLDFDSPLYFSTFDHSLLGPLIEPNELENSKNKHPIRQTATINFGYSGIQKEENHLIKTHIDFIEI